MKKLPVFAFLTVWGVALHSFAMPVQASGLLDDGGPVFRKVTRAEAPKKETPPAFKATPKIAGGPTAKVTQASAVKPQAEPAAETTSLRVLSESDVAVYKKLFRLQRELKRTAVVQNLKEVEDPLLMGHLVAERLLHPNTRSPYNDLQDWLSKYSDHAPARDIYKLANARKPRGETHKKPAVVGKSMGKYADPDAKFKKKNEDATQVKSQATRQRMLRRLKHYRVKKHYDKAVALLNKSTTKDLLGTDTFAQVSLKLARQMLNEGHFKLAESVADKVVRGSDSAQPLGLWISGFAAYRQNHFDDAAGTFRRLVYTVPPQSRYYAQAAWWAARAYEQLDRGSMSRVFLTMASHDKNSFYGQLALSRLDKKPAFSWVVPRIKPEDRKRLMADPAIRRVIALAQIGEHDLAQQELKAAYERIPYDMDESLLALSIEMDLPATSMTLARNLKERNKEYIAGLYPHSRTWQPFGGFEVDQALMFAIMRQESAFNPSIRSHAGAMGLMQVMPGTADHVRQMQGKRPVLKAALNRPDFNMAISQYYIQHLQQEMGDNLVHIIASYNAGPGNVRKWIARNGVDAENDPLLFIESIPFEETRKYVMRVMSNLWVYRTYFYGETPTLTAMANNRWPTQVAMVKMRDIDG